MTTRNRVERTRQLLAELASIMLDSPQDSYEGGLWYKMSRIIGAPNWYCNIDKENQKLTRLKEVIETLLAIYKVKEETK